MNGTAHIIKRDEARSAAVQPSPLLTSFEQGEVLQSETFLNQTILSPRRQRGGAPEEAAPPERPRRILRGEQARLAARPFEVAAATLAPASPLSTFPPAKSASPDKASPDKGSPDGGAAPEEKISPEAEAAAAREAEWQIRLEEAAQEAAQQAAKAARAEGYAQGYAEAEAKLGDAFKAERVALLADMDHLGKLWRQHIEESAPLLTELALEIAETLLDAPLPEVVRGASVQGVTDAVEQLADTPPVQIRLHPVDYLRLQEAGITDQLETVHDGLCWTPDPDLAEGDWSVQSPKAALRRLRTEIAQTVRSRLDLPDAAPGT